VQQVTVNVGSDSIAGDYLPGEPDTDDEFAVVWVHGFGSHRGGEKAASVREECRNLGWAFAAFDFRGHGESPGSMRELRASRLLEELDAVRAFLATEGRTRLGLIGSSMGGFASAWYAVQHPEAVIGCVLLAPAFGFLQRRWNSLSPAEREQWKSTDCLRVKSDWVEAELGYGLIEERDRFHPEELAARWNKPTLLFHGLADNVVLPEESLDFLRRTAYPGVELRLFKDGDHRLTAYKDEIAAEACRFLAAHIP
jgi:pimeloyl-ACP methyl ester carboxylesterase